MSKNQLLAAAALLSLISGAAYAQDKAKPPQSPAALHQGVDQGMMGGPQMMSGGSKGGMMGKPAAQHAAKEDGIVGISPVLSVDTVGATARLVVHRVAPFSPAYYAGITSGDQIVAVNSQPVEGKGLKDIAAAIRGEIGTEVKLSLSRDGQSRDVSLTRVEPISEHAGHRMWRHGRMGQGGMMGMEGDMMGGHQQGGMNGMMGMMGGMGRMMEMCNGMMRDESQPPTGQFAKLSPND